MPASHPTISNDLRICVDGRHSAALTPSEGLMLAETLTRKAFQRAMVEESAKVGIILDDSEPELEGAGAD